MKWILWLIPVGLVVYFLTQRKTAPQATVTNTGTATAAPDPFWKGWNNSGDRTLTNTTSTIVDFLNKNQSLTNNVTGWFGGASTATGSASDPSTNGSGAGVPVDSSGDPFAFDPNEYSW